MEPKERDSAVVEPHKPELRYRGIKAMPFIIGNETFEKLGTIGTSTNLLVYLTTVFNMKSITATTLVNTFVGTTNFSPLVGAYLCDTYFGRYATLGFASLSSFSGMLLLTLTAAIPGLHPSKCVNGPCLGPTAWQMAFLLFGFAFLVVGAGGIRPCNLAFGADQFDPNTDSGKRGISSFFNWYYFTYTFAMMVSLTGIVYVQSNLSWAIGLGIPTFLMLLSCLFFFAGSKIYVKVKPDGSPLTGAAQVLAAAFKKRRLGLESGSGSEPGSGSLFNFIPPTSINSKLNHNNDFKFLDKAAIITASDRVNADGSPSDPWRLCSVQQVEEMKCLIRLLPIWIAGLIFNLSVVQQQNYVVFQALQSDRRLGGLRIPAASYITFAMLSLTIWIPIYDQLIVPLLRRVTRKEAGITVLQKIGVGMVLSILTMVVSGLVEEKRRVVALTRPEPGSDPRRGAVSSLSANWLIPQLALSGLSEAFAVIGQVEFYYRQFPENMRSIGAAFLFCGFAGSSYVSNLLVSVVHHVTGGETGNWLAEDLNKGRLDLFYYLVAALQVVNLGYFLVVSTWYKYRGDSDGDEVELKKMNV